MPICGMTFRRAESRTRRSEGVPPLFLRSFALLNRLPADSSTFRQLPICSDDVTFGIVSHSCGRAAGRVAQPTTIRSAWSPSDPTAMRKTIQNAIGRFRRDQPGAETCNSTILRRASLMPTARMLRHGVGFDHVGAGGHFVAGGGGSWWGDRQAIASPADRRSCRDTPRTPLFPSRYRGYPRKTIRAAVCRTRGPEVPRWRHFQPEKGHQIRSDSTLFKGELQAPHCPLPGPRG